jgi:SAM-dependent methyltransferase
MVDTNEYLLKTKDYYNNRLGNETNSSELNMEDWFRWEMIEKKLKRFLEARSRKEINILDFGCGTGWLSHLLSKYGNVTGIDISEKAIELASQKYKGIHFVSFDASSKAFEKIKETTFDFIVSSEVIEHVQDQQEYFNNMMQLLKPNGFLILTTPNGQWKKNYFYKDRSNWGQPFEFWLDPDGIKHLAKPYLKDIHVSSFNSADLLNLKSFGLFNFFGNRFLKKFTRMLGLYSVYCRLLDKAGLGLYLILTGRKNGI